MVRYIDVHAQQRLKDLLETYLPACVADFEKVLQRTGAQIMGSFPLFCLVPPRRTWSMPGDLDIFLCPRLPSLMHRDLREFEKIFLRCGYQCVSSPQYDPFMQAPDGMQAPSMNVFTFMKGSDPNTLQVQVILYTGVFNSPDWHMQLMWAFDLSCCSVSYDGDSFQVTHDNLTPATQRVTIRRLNPSTTQRIEKYHSRGFAFVIQPLPFPNALLRSSPSVEALMSLCKLLLRHVSPPR